MLDGDRRTEKCVSLFRLRCLLLFGRGRTLHFFMRQGIHATVCLVLLLGEDTGIERCPYGLGRIGLVAKHQSVMIDVRVSQAVLIKKPRLLVTTCKLVWCSRLVKLSNLYVH